MRLVFLVVFLFVTPPFDALGWLFFALYLFTED